MRLRCCANRLPKRQCNRLRDEKGVAIPIVAVALVALVGITAVGVDTGRVAGVANEVQTAADIAALAGMASVYEGHSAEYGANAALDLNKVNGSTATNSLTTIEEGYIDSDYNFTPGGTPANAVRAEVSTVVDNIVLGAIGHPQTPLTREAIATLSGLGSGIPTIPIVLGECHYDPTCEGQSCMPSLSQVPDPTDNSGWTGFFDSASNSNVMDYMPAAPGCTGGGEQQFIRVGDIIEIGNGQTTPLLRAVECAIEYWGTNIFTIPIIECGHAYNQGQAVLGFAKIEVDFVEHTGSPKGIWLHGIWEGQRPGPPGGGQFGLLTMSLVK